MFNIYISRNHTPQFDSDFYTCVAVFCLLHRQCSDSEIVKNIISVKIGNFDVRTLNPMIV